MRQNFVVQFIQLIKHWLGNVGSDVVMEKNQAGFQLIMLAAGVAVFGASYRFAEHHRCDGFLGIQ